MITLAAANDGTSVSSIIESYASLGFGALILVVVGRSIYRLIGEWRDLATEARERESAADSELDSLRSALADERVKVAGLKSELDHERSARHQLQQQLDVERDARLTAERTMREQIDSLREQIDLLRESRDGRRG